MLRLKSFFITLFVRQNRYHKYSVFTHTMAVTFHCIKNKRFKMVLAALLHDIGKPVVAYQDPEDLTERTYSFTGHEERGYQIIKKWPIAQRTKILVRYHYLITGMAVDLRKHEDTGNQRFKNSFEARLKIWNSLDTNDQNELMIFKIFDDRGKGYPSLKKAVPYFLKDRLDEVESTLN